MSYGIVRVQKMKSSDIKGIEIHDRREKNGISHTNKDIKWDLTSKNYDLHTAQNSNFSKAVKERIGKLNLKRAVRKDAVVMSQVLVTSDYDFFKELNQEQQKQFFKDSYSFLAGRYGKENIISATVHLDEKTPHMHFNFVPVTADGRLSAKSVLTRSNLIQQQDDFFLSVGKKYNLKRGERSEQKKNHLETAEYKLKTITNEIKSSEKRLNALVGEILTKEKVDTLECKKSLTGNVSGLSYDNYKSLVRTAAQVDTVCSQNKNLQQLVNELSTALKQSIADTEKIEKEYKLFRKKVQSRVPRTFDYITAEKYYTTMDLSVIDIVRQSLKDRKIPYSIKKNKDNLTFVLETTKSDKDYVATLIFPQKEKQSEEQERRSGKTL